MAPSMVKRVWHGGRRKPLCSDLHTVTTTRLSLWSPFIHLSGHTIHFSLIPTSIQLPYGALIVHYNSLTF